MVVVKIYLNRDVASKLECISEKEHKSPEELVAGLTKDFVHKKSLKKIIVCNNFSLHMLDDNCNIDVKNISFEKFNKLLEYNDYKSCIGDIDIANKFNMEFNRQNIVLDENTRLLVIKSSDKNNNDEYSNFEFYDIQCGKCP